MVVPRKNKYYRGIRYQRGGRLRLRRQRGASAVIRANLNVRSLRRVIA